MLRISQEALTFDDILLVPGYSEVLPNEVNLKTRLTRGIELNIPLVSAAMDTVTEARLAIAMAQEGGIGIIHKNMTIEQQAAEVRKVKRYEAGVVKDPITIEADATVRDLFDLTRLHNISGVPVLHDGDLVGIVTSRDVRFENRLEVTVREVMTPKERLVTVKEGADKNDVRELLFEQLLVELLRQIGLVQHDQVGAGQLILEKLFQRFSCLACDLCSSWLVSKAVIKHDNPKLIDVIRPIALNVFTFIKIEKQCAYVIATVCQDALNAFQKGSFSW